MDAEAMAIGKVFALEGTAGSGKTTLISLIRAQLSDPESHSIILLPEVAESLMGIFPLGRRATIETEVAFLSGEAVRVARMSRLIQQNVNVIADRCWISNTVLGRVRQETSAGYSFDAGLFAVQERAFQILYPILFRNTVLIFLDLPPEDTLARQPWRLNLEDWVRRTYSAYTAHIDYLKEQQPIWIQKAAERAAQSPPEPPPPGVVAPLPEPIITPYAGIEWLDARQPVEQVLAEFKQIFKRYTGHDLAS